MAKNFTATVATPSITSSRKPRAKKSESIIMEHAVALETEDDEFSAMLAELGGVDIESDEVDAAFEGDDEEIDESELELAVGRAEATEVMMAAATPEGVFEGSAPTSGAVAKAGKAPKKDATPRKHYADKIERLKDRVGDKLSEYTVLTTADAMVDDDKLGEVMERTLEIIRGMNSKEKNRAGNFIEFLSGKRAKLNNVLERVLTVLDRDGFIQTGADGNVIKDLIARPYSMASARAMGGNTIGMYADFKVILADGKGRFIPNPDSLLLAKARSMLAAVVVAPAAVEVDEVEELEAAF